MSRQYQQVLAVLLSLLLGYIGIQMGSAQELVGNGGFETGITGWSLFVPDESKGKNCRFDVVSDAPHSGTNCVRLQSDDFARFGIGTTGFPVQPGDHYHISAWIRADAAAQVRPKAPGFIIRLNLRQGTGEAAGGHLFIGPGNVVSRENPADSSAGLPKDWTLVEAVVEIPPGVDSVLPSIFSWWVNGTLFVDDFSIQKVDPSTPVTPLAPNNPGASAMIIRVPTIPIAANS